ncbi:MAG: DNA repair protein MmcB-related protein [Hyphomicrobium sp.]|jgi:hypothetical protein|nr:DNA repair protein MmcB-related protein [Hyphomicrobium sp.]PPD09377.1 MAG: hypothetical protein CTY28_00710 [Hyphomicrobium sp.]
MTDPHEPPDSGAIAPSPDAPLSSDPVALEILRGTARMLIDAGLTPIAEFTLPNGRRADIAALDRTGILTIIEIKSSLADFRSDQKWPEYAEYCDRFFFAVKPDFPREILPAACGLILADRYGAEILRPAAPAPPLTAARRKVLTLRFARTASLRLAAVIDPGLKARSEAKDI